MKTTKNFNLNLFKAGKKAQTKLGNPVMYKGISVRNELIVMVLPRCSGWEQVKYQLDGKKYKGIDTMYDLEMVEAYPIA